MRARMRERDGEKWIVIEIMINDSMKLSMDPNAISLLENDPR